VNGAESLVRTALAAGVDVCFTNPGTTEMHLVGALDAAPGMRAVLGLFEGVCTGAADGYARMAGRPALSLLHLGPGMANGIANLHNARRARSPIVSVVGDQATWHLANDAPLTSDIESLARPVSKWVRTSKTAADLAVDTAAAIAAAQTVPQGVTTLIVPSDCAWGSAAAPAPPQVVPAPGPADADAIEDAASALRRGEPAILLLGSSALLDRGLRAAARVASASGCRLMSDTFVARLDRGAPLPGVERLPYFPEQLIEVLSGAAHLVLAGTVEPVSFFAYPGTPGRPRPESCQLHAMAGPEHDAVAALEALADALGAGPSAPRPEPGPRPERPSGALSVSTLAAAIASVQPEGAIVVDEAATSGAAYPALSVACPPHSVLGLTGGAIGQGLPCATGAAIACPERPVIAFQADGSGMYTVQSLWTQAREGLNVTTVLCSNREYRILRVELARADIQQPGPQAEKVTSLSNPDLDWVSISRGLGVPATRAETADALVRDLERALAEPGPHLIQAVI
jgi:acetolactate synthase-1/2/3 large subunit